MKNRFFDVDNNIYLNSLYIVAIMFYSKEPNNIEKIMLKLFLIKYPKIMIDICEKFNVKIEKNLLFEFQYDNLQSEMLKYSLRLHVDGVYDTLAYLYSKKIITYDNKLNFLVNTDIFEKIDLEIIPENTRMLANVINEIFEKFEINDIKKSIKFIERSYYEK